MPIAPDRVGYAPLCRARRAFVMGGTEIVAGDVLDLSDPEWGLPAHRGVELVSHGYVIPVTDEQDVTRSPEPPAVVEEETPVVASYDEGVMAEANQPGG